MRLGQQLKGAGSMSLHGGRVQCGFGLFLNLTKVETVQYSVVVVWTQVGLLVPIVGLHFGSQIRGFIKL